MLGTDCVLWAHGYCRASVHRCAQVEDHPSLFLSAELVRRSVSLCHPYRTVSTRSLCPSVQVCWFRFKICILPFTQPLSLRFGFCKQKANKYKMSYSVPLTNQTSIPLTLSGRRTSSMDQGQPMTQSRKVSRDFIQEEDYVWRNENHTQPETNHSCTK